MTNPAEATIASPAVCRRRLGSELRRLRQASSLRLEDAVATLDVAPSTLSRIENGQAPTRTSYLYVLLDLYLRREAPCHIPGAAGGNSEGGFWV